jgi:cytochrome c-type biogenesis protein CcmH/NrfG
MRLTPVAAGLALIFAMTSSVGVGQKATPVDPRSASWVQRGNSALASGSFESATDAFETALALDPRNRNAYVGLAQVAHGQNLPGKEIRFYDEALQADPKDVTSLQAQGMAMLARGAIESARGNLGKIKLLCRNRCEAADRLSSAITARGAQARATPTPDRTTPSPAPVASQQ